MEPIIRRSEQINELVAAMAKARGTMDTPKRNCKNPFFNSEYADLASLHEVSRDALATNGLHPFQVIGRGEQGEVVVATLLGHSSGQWIESMLSVMPGKEDGQSIGKCATYLRRYAYGALLQLASEPDDDGNSERKEDAEPCAARPPQGRKPGSAAEPPKEEPVHNLTTTPWSMLTQPEREQHVRQMQLALRAKDTAPGAVQAFLLAALIMRPMSPIAIDAVLNCAPKAAVTEAMNALYASIEDTDLRTKILQVQADLESAEAIK